MTSITKQLRNVCNSPFDRDQAISLYRTLKGKGPKKNKSNEDLLAILRYISDMLQVMDDSEYGSESSDSEKTSSRCAYGSESSDSEKTSSRCAYGSESGDSEKTSSRCAYSSESGDSEKTSSRCAYGSKSGDSEKTSSRCAYGSESGDYEKTSHLKIMPYGLSQQYRDHMVESKCIYCRRDLSTLPIIMNKHDGWFDGLDGWFVPGSNHRWWLYVECPKCKQQRSLSKMGVGYNALMSHEL
jgi:hypothetical protein